jgi:hypothetical protein
MDVYINFDKAWEICSKGKFETDHQTAIMLLLIIRVKKMWLIYKRRDQLIMGYYDNFNNKSLKKCRKILKIEKS